jgi:hypothetical protein
MFMAFLIEEGLSGELLAGRDSVRVMPYTLTRRKYAGKTFTLTVI